MNDSLSQPALTKILDWAYEKAINGVVGLDSAHQLAAGYTAVSGSRRDQANALIRWQVAKAATSGFVTGLGGLLTLPLTLPANITSVLFLQVRMIAAIACVGGHDVRDDRVKALVYICLVGSAGADLAKDIGVTVSTKLGVQALKGISGKTLTAINQKVGFRLLTKFGEKGVINLGKAVPILGGLVGGTFDSVTTNTIGNVARDMFITE